MTSTAMTSFPVSAAGALLTGSGRGLLWVLTRFFRMPFTSSGLIILTVGTAMALGNALYMQPDRHPAPLFVADPGLARPAATPPAEPAPLPVVSNDPAPAAPATTGTASTAPAAEPDVPGNPEVAAVQRKLAELNLFDGTIDGFYGPKTADAIRAFEERAGLPLRGALSPQVMDAILRANPATIAQPRPEALAPAAAPAVEAVPAQEPVPQQAQVQTAAVPDAPAPTLDPAPVAEVRLEQVAATGTEATQSQAPAAASGPANPVLDTELVARVQRGLASLGFLHGTIDGVPGDSTARAIRNFEVYHNYDVTGAVTLELVHMLEAAGAAI